MEQPAPEPGGAPQSRAFPGLRFETLSAEHRTNRNLPPDLAGVVVTEVLPAGRKVWESLRRGDVVVEIDGSAIESRGRAEEILARARTGDLLRLYVQRFDGDGDPTAFFEVVRVP